MVNMRVCFCLFTNGCNCLFTNGCNCMSWWSMVPGRVAIPHARRRAPRMRTRPSGTGSGHLKHEATLPLRPRLLARCTPHRAAQPPQTPTTHTSARQLVTEPPYTMNSALASSLPLPPSFWGCRPGVLAVPRTPRP
jgi:hypothetical protein